MRILHVWDHAAVSCTLAKYQHEICGHETRVIKRRGFDPYGIMGFYGRKSVRSFTKYGFYLQVMRAARAFDLIHIHDLHALVPIIKGMSPEKRVILHYHGPACYAGRNAAQAENELKADRVLVATPDLLSLGGFGGNTLVTYVPNPVDTAHFNPEGHPWGGPTVYPAKDTENISRVRVLMSNRGMGVNFRIMSRAANPVMYADMPRVLGKYGRVIDVNFVRGQIARAHSMTGLQALALGLEVVNHDFEVVRGLPDRHTPAGAVMEMEEVYDSVS